MCQVYPKGLVQKVFIVLSLLEAQHQSQTMLQQISIAQLADLLLNQLHLALLDQPNSLSLSQEHLFIVVNWPVWLKLLEDVVDFRSLFCFMGLC